MLNVGWIWVKIPFTLIMKSSTITLIMEKNGLQYADVVGVDNIKDFKMLQRREPTMQAYFGWEKPCSCSYCCSRHLWFYDRGRLGRVEVVTLRIGARAKEGKGGGGEEKKYAVFPSLSPPPSRSLWHVPFPPLFGSFNMALSRAKPFARPKKTPALQATTETATRTSKKQ